MNEAADVLGPSESKPTFHLPPEFVQEVSDALASEDHAAARVLIQPLHAADLAYLLDMLKPEGRGRLLELVGPHLEPEVVTYLSPALREDVLHALGMDVAAGTIARLEGDDAVDVMEALPEETRQRILAVLPREARSDLEEGLAYAENTAGRLMSKQMVTVPQYWTVGDVIDFMRGETEKLPRDFYKVIVVDPRYRPVGGVLLSRIMRSQRETPVNALIDDEPRQINVQTDQEEVGYLFRRYGLVEAPVVNGEGRLVGVVTVDDVVDVIQEEAEEDILRLGGVKEGDLYSAVWQTVQSRFPWLLVNLGTAIAASLVIGLFEDTIGQLVALAVLMPIVASMGGNAGTQTVTVAVRALATHEMTEANAMRVIGKELLVGLMNGLVFAAVSAVAVYAWYGDPVLSLVFALATVITLMMAGVSGALIPYGLMKLGADPAIASSVFLTTVTDVIGFLAFLGLAAWVLL